MPPLSLENIEALARMNIRQALKNRQGKIVVVCGAWHLSGLRASSTASDDRTLIKDLPKIKVGATWVPWTDSRLSVRSGYGAGVFSRLVPASLVTLWTEAIPGIDQFAAQWQAKTAITLRGEGYAASTASAIEAARLALCLSAMRGLSVPGLAEMREASLATLCHGDTMPMLLIEQKLYIGFLSEAPR